MAETYAPVGSEAIAFHSSGIVDRNESTYLYAPSVVFDERSGRYQFWGCGGVDGDFIIYKEAGRLENLVEAPWRNVLRPLKNHAFDSNHTCDPSVLRAGGRLYLYYGGIDETAPDVERTTRIGVAVSSDGVTFERLNGGRPIVDPLSTLRRAPSRWVLMGSVSPPSPGARMAIST